MRFAGWLKSLAKLLLGALVLGWMVWTHKVDPRQVARSLSYWPLMLALISLGYGQIAVTTWRWQLLIQAQRVSVPFRSAWSLTMIGMLFNVVVPGSVGGDLAKGYYVARAVEGRATEAAASVILDRIIGLIGLLFLGTVMSMVSLPQIVRDPRMLSLGAAIVGGFLGMIVCLYLAMILGRRIGEFHKIPVTIRKAFQAIYAYHGNAPVLLLAFALSVLNQLVACTMYYIAFRATGAATLPLAQFFLIVPLGLVATAIPLSPAGLGVGQAAFYGLFKLVAPQFASAGSDAITVYQLAFIFVCLTGTFWYASYKHGAFGMIAGMPAGGTNAR